MARAKSKQNKEKQAREEKEMASRKVTRATGAKNDFDQALEVWRTDSDLSEKLAILYEEVKASGKASGKNCMDKDNSISLILGKASDIEMNYAYPPHLRRIATILVCLPVSSARVERIFSHLKLMFSKRRLRLNTDVVKQLMFLGINECVPNFTIKEFS